MVTVSLVATGCSAPGATSESASFAPASRSTGSSPVPVGLTPSAFARTICEPKLRADLTRTLGFSRLLHSSVHLSENRYTCTYSLPTGRLVVSVKAFRDTEAARTYFDILQHRVGSTTRVRGLAALGLPAFKTQAGRTVYLKSREILDVNATDLPPLVGIIAQSRGVLADYFAVRTIWPDT